MQKMMITDVKTVNDFLSSGDPRVLKFLKDGIIPIDIKLTNKETIFHPIVLIDTEKQHTFLKGVLAIVEEKNKLSELLNTPDDEGILPIHYALIKNNFDAAEMLLKHGAIYNKKEIKDVLSEKYSFKEEQAVDNFECWLKEKSSRRQQEAERTQVQSVVKKYQTDETQKSWIDNGLTLFKSIFIDDTPSPDEGKSLINKYKKIN